MLKITILQIGKTKTSYLTEGEEEFKKRLQAFCQLEVKVLKDVKSKSPPEQIEATGSAILENLPGNSYLIVLDERGQEFTSQVFAQKLNSLGSQGHSHLTFVIGGPYGLDQRVKAKANLLLACSKFTFTHEMVRMILLEQLYRAFTISTGKKYHY
ncbi:MAG: 23S rRNA (pseudouridine(1915)-N(3))-methyltransferase RlmH [Candidatus Gracilibacteria bacterium]|nr:23S rRNA (pseudouridine(1915)-N(3))-methyltransferase RlmH [Candidatus Gracilibacteria bacterium]